MKRILCVLREPNEYLLRQIYEAGRLRGWNIENGPEGKVPCGWSGDGVCSDYVKLEELRKISGFAKTPIVSRQLEPTRNIRTIRPDVRKIASMVAEYFTSKGFSRFASVARKVYYGERAGMPDDILEALAEEIHSRKLSYERCLWSEILPPEKLRNYQQVENVIVSFFRELRTPFALVLSSPEYLPICYRVFDKLGMRVPDEVAVLVNTDERLITDNAVVPTSYISGEFGELGLRMVETLERMMAGETLPEAPIFTTPSCIVERRSTDALAVADQRLAAAVSFILCNYHLPIGVDDVAREAGVSRGTLGRLFARDFSRSPLRFLQEIRYNQIRQLLDTSSLPLAAIAKKSGYGSDMAMSLAFKREMNMTPGEYRRSRKFEKQTRSRK